MYSSSVSPSTAEPNYVLPYNAKCKRKLAARIKCTIEERKREHLLIASFSFFYIII